MKTISTENAPKALGPYSQGKIAAGLLFISGQGGIDPATGTLVDGVANQTRQAIRNIDAILKEAGLTASDVVKTTCFLKDMADFQEFNGIYGEFFSGKPARSCIQAAELPAGFLIEIEVIAATSETSSK